MSQNSQQTAVCNEFSSNPNITEGGSTQTSILPVSGFQMQMFHLKQLDVIYKKGSRQSLQWTLSRQC